MTVDEAIKQVSEELKLEECVVRRVYYSMFECIIEKAAEIPFKKEFLSREEFEKLNKVFYMPGLGKIVTPYSRYKKVWEAYLKKKAKPV